MSNNKRNILLLTGVLILGALFYSFKTLFPLSPDLDPITNELMDRTIHDKRESEAAVLVNPLNNLYFGDLHVHTAMSFDAFLGGTLATPSDAYRYASGLPVTIFGHPVRIERPLDFVAVTDHSESMGEIYTVQHPEEPGYNAFVPRYFRSVYNNKFVHGINTKRQQVLNRILLKKANKKELKHPSFFRGFETTKKAWTSVLEAAEDAYEPGVLTTFAGFEWSLMEGEAHLHRNVIFRDMIVPEYPLSSFETQNEEELWAWLKEITGKGATVMAIPHNTNLAEGGAFTYQKPNGDLIDAVYAQMRQDYEPLVEIHQAKGNSEVHAAFWKNDEFGGFENYTSKPEEINYVRYALKKGLALQDTLGVNPFKFGLIGSTDTHSATPGNTEENDTFLSNHAYMDYLPESRRNNDWALDGSRKVYEVVNPGGLVAVWAGANTRGHIYDALKKKEVYATSGSRIKVRFFGGNGFSGTYADHDELLKDGYAHGVPMGGDLSASSNEAPQFLIWASKDELAANLDRIQVIKGWTNGGPLHEQIYNVALSDGRIAQPNGKADGIEAPVDLTTGQWARDKGAEELMVLWTDPDFDPDAHAFYYLRVLELPTANWKLWDKIRYGTAFPEGTEMTTVERAWSSPIWYSPAADR